MAKYTVISKKEGKEFPYSQRVETQPGVSLQDHLSTKWMIEKDEIQCIFEGWPRRVSLAYWEEDIENCEFRPFLKERRAHDNRERNHNFSSGRAS